MRTRIPVAARLDPLAKALWLITVSVTGAALTRPEHLVYATALTSCTFCLCSIAELRELARYRWVIASVPMLLFAYHLLFLPAARIEGHGFLQMTLSAAIYSLKILNSVLALCFMLISTDIRHLVDRMIAAGIPKEAAFAVFLMLRFMEIMGADAAQIRDALLIRAGGRKWSRAYLRLMSHRYVTTLVVLGMLRAEQTAMAMDLRGFASRAQRSALSHPQWLRGSWLLPLAYLVLLIAAIFLF
jgi:energy-coupling factor transporter transmembrane protein EcfT